MQLVCVAQGFFGENKFKVNFKGNFTINMKLNLKSDNYQGDINLRRKRGEMINEENKYLAQSDSEYREQQKKEDELYMQLKQNKMSMDEFEKNLYDIRNTNEDFFEMSYKNKSI